jgi:flagellar motor switch protein FliM
LAAVKEQAVNQEDATAKEEVRESLREHRAEVTGVRVYDFTSPNRLSKEQIRRIEYLHTTFVKRASMSLAALLRGPVRLSIKSVEEADYSVFIESIPSPGATFTFKAEPLEGFAIIDTDIDLAFSLIDRLLGGKGEPLAEPRELTSIEQTVAKTIVTTLVREIEWAWSSLAQLKMGVQAFAIGAEAFQIYGSSTSIVAVEMKVTTDSTEGTICIGYPYPMFEPVLREIAKTLTFRTKREPDEKTMSQLISVVPMALAARLPVSMVKIKDIANLEVGDVIVLDTHVGDEVDLLVEGKRLFQARPGEHRGALAVKVTRTITQGGSSDGTR